MNSDFFATGKTRGTFSKVAATRDVKKIRQYGKTVNICIVFAQVIMVLLCLWVAATLAVSAFEAITPEDRAVPARPALAYEAPSSEYIDKTQWANDSKSETAHRFIEQVYSDTGLSLAVYNSTEPAHDVYSEFFSGERGCVVYLEEHQSYGTITFYWGERLNYLFTPATISYLTSDISALERRTTDRLSDVLTKLSDNFNELFIEPEPDYTLFMIELGCALLFVLLAFIFAIFMNAIICSYAGLPKKRNDRKQYVDYICDQIQNGTGVVSEAARPSDGTEPDETAP